MVTLTRIYTKSGDKGKTSLGNGARVVKYDLRVETIGTVDEANTVIGLCRLHADAAIDTLLSRIQNDLFDVGADLCVPVENGSESGGLRIVESQTLFLEKSIDVHNAELTPLNSFVLPGGSALATHLHLARTVVRRAERFACAISAEAPTLNQEIIRYLNRLSDLLFVLARIANNKGQDDVLWIPGASRDH